MDGARPRACEALRIARVLGVLGEAPGHRSELARENYDLLKANPYHPSLHFKRVGRFWSVRVGRSYRALAVDAQDNIVWFWIGTHAEYDRLVG